MIKVSVIIPTLNRSSSLENALISILNQSFPKDEYEIIVIDNGSTDNTKQVIENLNQAHNNRIRYFYDNRPGLHIGRHVGAKKATGEILLYGDDDIIASPDWVKEIYACYSNKEVGVAGGKIIPRFESEPPEWLKIFPTWYLSLLDLGDKCIEIESNQIFGCNLSIRKKLLFECGGFHPDALPQEMMKYRGDGETALMKNVGEAGYKIVHNPKALICHVIPSSRLTIDYFKKRAFNQGISDSFTHIKKYSRIKGNRIIYKKMCGEISAILSNIKHFNFEYLKYYNSVRNAYYEGIKFHQNEVKNDSELLKYILEDNYF